MYNAVFDYNYTSPKKGLCDYHKYYDNGAVNITDDGVNDLICLIDIVKNTHYMYVHDEFLIEDMCGAAMVKLLEFINSNTYDPSRGSLKNILYTCARNEMKNIIYRSGRDFPVEDEVMSINEAPHLQVTTSAIEVKNIEKWLPRCSKEEIMKVKSSMNYLGFITDSDTRMWYPEVTRWVALVVFKRLKK